MHRRMTALVSIVATTVLTAGCAQVTVNPAGSEQPKAPQEQPDEAVETVTVTKGPKTIVSEDPDLADTTVTVTKEPKRPRRKPKPPGADSGATLPETNQNYATFPVKKYIRAKNTPQRVSAPVPSWMGTGRVGHNNHLQFSVDGVQLLLGSRSSRGSDKAEVLLTRQDLWQQEYPAKIVYKKNTSKGFVLSGTTNGHIFYEVYEFRGGTEYFASWFYPQSLKKQMNPVITKFYKGFTVS